MSDCILKGKTERSLGHNLRFLLLNPLHRMFSLLRFGTVLIISLGVDGCDTEELSLVEVDPP